MKAGALSSAEFLRSNGWGVGTILYGAPIWRDGKEIESWHLLRITAVGDSSILARSKLRGRGEWDRESSWGFNSREWSEHVAAGETLSAGDLWCIICNRGAEGCDHDFHAPACNCQSCTPDYAFFRVCGECGNKRCPKATHHDNPCGHSNEPGQPGSSYPAGRSENGGRGAWCSLHLCAHWFEPECSNDCAPLGGAK